MLAIMSNTSLVMLDEPCANLDNDAVDWYQNLKQQYGKLRTFVICSNHNAHEYPEVSKVFPFVKNTLGLAFYFFVAPCFFYYFCAQIFMKPIDL
jgi:ABC-type Mn2+/Zn2+ transport system ATPase subunit